MKCSVQKVTEKKNWNPYIWTLKSNNKPEKK